MPQMKTLIGVEIFTDLMLWKMKTGLREQKRDNIISTLTISLPTMNTKNIAVRNVQILWNLFLWNPYLGYNRSEFPAECKCGKVNLVRCKNLKNIPDSFPSKVIKMRGKIIKFVCKIIGLSKNSKALNLFRRF